ncbi:MAG: flagellar biosynthesis protein FlhB [Paucibacter sp.]|nr:flagellar biosynthesis protein FlhB [Roseateles sp.]
MAEQSAQDRNLPASAKKIKRSRAEGQVPRSRDLVHFSVIAAAGLVLAFIGPGQVEVLRQMFQQGLHFDAHALEDGAMGRYLAAGTWQFMGLLLRICGSLALAAMLANLALGGWNWTWKPLIPKFSHLDPLAGFGRLFTGAGLGQALKAVALALVLGTVGAMVLQNRVTNFIGIMSVPLPNALSFAASQVSTGLGLVAIALAIFAAIDVPLQRTLYLRRLRMTREELKQEMRDVEGSPEIKRRMRMRMRELSRRRMLTAVPKADLVVMNPTHYAVALRYEDGKMAAPKVIAKGADLLALKIRDIARESKVPVLQSPVLARALYAHAKLDHEIPAALFTAVAQVLAYVYQLKAAMAMVGAQRRMPPEPNPFVPPELDPHNTPGYAERHVGDVDEESEE